MVWIKSKGMGIFYGKCLKRRVGHNKLKMRKKFLKKTKSFFLLPHATRTIQ